MKKFYNVKYIPTGIVYNLPKEEADRLVTEESVNFSVVDDDYEAPISEEPAEPTVYEKVVEEEPKKQEKKDKTEKKQQKKDKTEKKQQKKDKK